MELPEESLDNLPSELKEFFQAIDNAKYRFQITNIFLEFQERFYNEEFGAVTSKIVHSSVKLNEKISEDDKTFLKYALKIYLLPAQYGFSSLDALIGKYRAFDFFDKVLVDCLAIYFSSLLLQKDEFFNHLKWIIEQIEKYEDFDFDSPDAVRIWLLDLMQQDPDLNILDAGYELQNLNIEKTAEGALYGLRRYYNITPLKDLSTARTELDTCSIDPLSGKILKVSSIDNQRVKDNLEIIKPDLEFCKAILEQANSHGIHYPVGAIRLLEQLSSKNIFGTQEL